MLTLQCLQGFLLPLPSLLVLLMSPVYPWRKLLELLQVALNSFSRSIERFPVLGLLPVRMLCQMVQDEVGVTVQE